MSLVVLAHGTGNPSGPRTVEAVAARVRLRLPGVPVRTAYAELQRPSLTTVLAESPPDTVVVPLPCAHDVGCGSTTRSWCRRRWRPTGCSRS